MRINLSGKCNKDTGCEQWINGIVLITGETEMFLDRKASSYSYDENTGKFEISWENVYLWDGENEDYDKKHIIGAVDKATCFVPDIEDDAPEDVEIYISELSFIDDDSEGHSLKCHLLYPDYCSFLNGLPPKYTVNVAGLSGSEVYRGNNPKEALFAWAVASYCAPQRVAIKTSKNAYARELIDTANSNKSWLKEHCSLEGFPYSWEMIENGVNDKVIDGCIYFRDSKYLDAVYPFSVA